MKKKILNYAAAFCLLSALYSCKKEREADTETPQQIASVKQGELTDLKGTPMKAYYRGEPVTVEKVDDDTYVLYGDIILSKKDITFEGQPVVESNVQGNLWNNRIVYYVFNANATTKLRSDWNSAMTWFTGQGFQFVQSTNANGYIEVQENTNGQGFSNSLGRSGSMQIISVDSKAHGVYAVAHEIGHAIGLHHEQQRPDRDLYMNAGSTTGSWYVSTTSFGVGTMDYNSIMLYSAYSGSATKKDGSTWTVNHTSLSSGDIAGLNYMYNRATHIASGTYEIKSQKNTANNLHVASGNITSTTDNSSSHQRWQFTHVSDGYYKIINVANGQALDVSGAGTSSGTDVTTWTYGGGNHQLWQVVPGHVSGTYRIHPKHALTLCLGLNGTSTASGTEVRIYKMTLDGGQLWRLQKQ